jgi:hypothetical protein
MFVAFQLTFWSIFLKSDPDPTEEGEFGAVVGEREGCGCWRGDDAEDLWCVGNLEPKTLTVKRATRLGQELHGMDLCNVCPLYMS